MPRNENGSNTDINEEPRTTDLHAILNAGQFARPTRIPEPYGIGEITNMAEITSDIARNMATDNFQQETMPKVQQHERICHDLNRLYERKNHDYGDAFAEDYATYGLIMPVIRLDDKLRRLKHFVQNNDIRVTEESIEDTLMDLANYSIMTIIELCNHR